MSFMSSFQKCFCTKRSRGAAQEPRVCVHSAHLSQTKLALAPAAATIIMSSPDVAVKVNVHVLFTEKNGKKSNNRKLPLEDGVLATSQRLAGRVNF